MRRIVVEAVSDTRFSAQPASGQGHLDVYLALLQDSLPVYVGVMSDLLGQAGQATVRGNLTTAAQVTIDFYRSLFPAKLPVLASPAQLIRLRQVMRAGGFGPERGDEAIADYLRREQKLGRVGPDVDPLAVARLLTGGCLGYVYNMTLMGGDDLPSGEEYAAGIAHGLRLD
ncbi:hypothetical protein DPM19_19210 [Actinomadura craniellae]|uniref:Uncharacterized protein n=1 Tax=Actinomadura craniellae TaxID=2231787 RepID=A0A365H6B4_9ACTN|nr:hypothetical protein DPM19_19210 [Actinomadura craniellae]